MGTLLYPGVHGRASKGGAGDSEAPGIIYTRFVFAYVLRDKDLYSLSAPQRRP